MGRRSASIASASMLLAVCVAATASAQDVREAEAPAHISLVEGVAILERDGRTDDSPANMPLLAGDRVRTRAGRLEILFADGSTLHLDHNSAIDLQSDELVRLLDGRIRLSIPARTRDVSYRIDGPHAWAQISEPGEYRGAVIQNAGQTELEFAVLRGAAALVNEEGQTTLRAGERAFARANTAPSHAYVFNSASWDPFDRWSDARRSERFGVSTQYLPDEVRPYAGALDRHGAWQYESSYGYVWYPRVDYGWRPYYHGRWTPLRPYGWTWIGNDPWAWPTHHYGRWGFSSAGAWFWIPGRAWAPAWVSWAYAPGYVSWCPLGFNNRPVIQIIDGYRGYDPWRAWTVVPHRQFGVGFVHRTVVRSAAIDSRTRGSFASRDGAPAITGYAASRATAIAPIRVAGTAAVRRGTSTGLSGSRGSVSDTYRSAAPGRAIDRRGVMPRAEADSTGVRPGSDRGQTVRTVPTRPLVRSARPERGSRSTEPGGSVESPGIRTYDAARPGAGAPQIYRDREASSDRPTYGRDPGSSGVSPYEPGNRRVSPYEPASRSASPYDPAARRGYPRGENARPAGESRSPQRPDRPGLAPAGAHDRRAPAADRPASAQPVRPGHSAPPASAEPAPGPRSRPSGDAPTRGTAVRRPGGGR